jgi:pectate lyase
MQRIIMTLFLLFVAVLFDSQPARSQTCPGFVIEGFARNTVGGCGGTVYTVTNLNDSGPGSLRDAVNRSGPRIINFSVSGTITLSNTIYINNPFITIDGSTAPNGGIAIKSTGGTDGVFGIRTWEVIIRHIRVRPGNSQDNNRGIFILNPDPDINPGKTTYNVVIDHCSISWFIDDGTSVWGSPIRDITWQYNIISGGLNTLSVGRAMLIEGPNGLSVHHNLFAHNMQRHPEAKWATIDWVNNIIYNWGGQPAYVQPVSGPVNGNWVGNYWKHGSDTVFANPEFRFNGGSTYSSTSSEYVSDNKMDSLSTGVQNARIDQDNGGLTVNGSRFAYPAVTTTSAISNYSTLLANVGANSPCRDSVDQRVINDVINRTGRIITSQSSVGGWPDLSAGCSSTALSAPSNLTVTP